MNASSCCTRCVMDTSDPEITYDDRGVCNHCRYYDQVVRPVLLPPDRAAIRFAEVVRDVKAMGRRKQYDCLLGVSGGVDSSYLAHLAKSNGLRTLLIHMDNGWDSELAVQNIERIVKGTGFDYYNHVIDWEEFRDLQVAYLRASVIDIEVVTDHAITALTYRVARKFGIKVMLDGNNAATESLMPRAWVFSKGDLANLLAIHRRFGSVPLRTYPTLSIYDRLFQDRFHRLRSMSLLNLVPYRLEDAIRTLQAEFGWRYYGGKHWESLFTKFYQAYILPIKFNVDKRRVHLSNLINSGQLTREEALQRLKAPVYPAAELQTEYEYVVKKLGLTAEEFEKIMAAPPVPHLAYGVEQKKPSRMRRGSWTIAGRTIEEAKRLIGGPLSLPGRFLGLSTSANS